MFGSASKRIALATSAQCADAKHRLRGRLAQTVELFALRRPQTPGDGFDRCRVFRRRRRRGNTSRELSSANRSQLSVEPPRAGLVEEAVGLPRAPPTATCSLRWA